VTGALDVEDRRSNERELLRHYVDALTACGGPLLPEDDAWHDYRRFSMHGFLWATTPAVMQPWANVRAMAERHTAAILDLDALDALGALSDRSRGA
jgi:hypothetical protein